MGKAAGYWLLFCFIAAFGGDFCAEVFLRIRRKWSRAIIYENRRKTSGFINSWALAILKRESEERADKVRAPANTKHRNTANSRLALVLPSPVHGTGLTHDPFVLTQNAQLKERKAGEAGRRSIGEEAASGGGKWPNSQAHVVEIPVGEREFRSRSMKRFVGDFV